VSFGSPRVGNSYFVESYNKRVPNTLRFVNKNDMVCKVPPFWLSFRHVDKEIVLDRKWYDWFRIITKTLGNPWDHLPERYRDHIKELEEF
jgi:hypothetical protein